MARMKFSVKLVDKGLKDITKRVHQMTGGAKVAVGVRGNAALAKKKTKEETEGEKLRLVDIATIHEYGSFARRIPERSFIRATVKENTAAYKQIMLLMAKQVLDPRKRLDPLKALAILGERVKADIQKRIRAGIGPELSERTLEARRRAGSESTLPLVVTGQLVNSISYEVRKGK